MPPFAPPRTPWAIDMAKGGYFVYPMTLCGFFITLVSRLLCTQRFRERFLSGEYLRLSLIKVSFKVPFYSLMLLRHSEMFQCSMDVLFSLLGRLFVGLF